MTPKRAANNIHIKKPQKRLVKQAKIPTWEKGPTKIYTNIYQYIPTKKIIVEKFGIPRLRFLPITKNLF